MHEALRRILQVNLFQTLTVDTPTDQKML